MPFAVLCLLSSAPPCAQAQPSAVLRPGAYAAGLRLIDAWDRGRSVRPAVDFRGRSAAGDITVPMRLSVWYPAVRPRAGAPMPFGALLLAAVAQDRSRPPSAADSAAARARVTRSARFAGVDPSRPEAQPDSTLRSPTRAYRDAAPAQGTFPVVIVAAGGGAGDNISVLAEYLATHGWIVVVTPGQSPASAGFQATNPPLAIDAGLHAIEFAVATAYSIPHADLSRLAVIGLNFDSFSALEYQMRYMRARAIVTINGWETIDDRANALRSSPWFEPTRIRVPVFNVHWDQPGAAPANRRYLDTLRYADRRSVVIRGLDHVGLIENPLAYPFAGPARHTGYRYLVRAVHAVLSPAVGDSADPFLERAPADEGFPADILADTWHRAALPAVPTRQEFAEIIWDQRDIATATRVFHDARSRDSTVQLFTVGEMNLYAFRYQQLGLNEETGAIHRLAIEGYPRSPFARNNFGNFLLARADTAGAIREFEAAIDLLAGDSTLPDQERAEQARVWRARMAALARR